MTNEQYEHAVNPDLACGGRLLLIDPWSVFLTPAIVPRAA
jgi:hypothetical protein